MIRGRIPLTITLLAATAPAAGDNGGQLRIRAEPASVEIAQRPVERRTIDLPNLDFPLTIEPSCEPGKRIESLSISAADTRQRFAGSDFDAEPVIQTTLSLPPQQLGPLMINRFCITDDEGADGNHSTRIADAFVAHASLHCADDASNAIIYVAVSLDIELSCKAAVPPEEADDQEASSSESRF